MRTAQRDAGVANEEEHRRRVLGFNRGTPSCAWWPPFHNGTNWTRTSKDLVGRRLAAPVARAIRRFRARMGDRDGRNQQEPNKSDRG